MTENCRKAKVMQTNANALSAILNCDNSAYVKMTQFCGTLQSTGH